jgi:hypothetical protein
VVVENGCGEEGSWERREGKGRESGQGLKMEDWQKSGGLAKVFSAGNGWGIWQVWGGWRVRRGSEPRNEEEEAQSWRGRVLGSFFFFFSDRFFNAQDNADSGLEKMNLLLPTIIIIAGILP